MARPITHELQHVWITADGEKFLNENDAKEHHKKIVSSEKEDIEEEIEILKERLKEYENNINNSYGDSISVEYSQKQGIPRYTKHHKSG